MGRGEAVAGGLSFEAAFESETALRSFAETFGRCLNGGEVIGMVGTLGAGKTVFAQGLARGLGIPETVAVVSPTFVLHRRYIGRCRLEHLDAYRLGSAAELAAIGCGEILESGGVVAIEWAEKVKDILPDHTIWVEFEITGPSSRRLGVRIPPAELLPAETARALEGLARTMRPPERPKT